MDKPILTIEMPDGEVKELSIDKELDDDWYTNKDIFRWIAENIDLGIDNLDVIIRRDGNGNKVCIFTDCDKKSMLRFREVGLNSLIDAYTLLNLIVPDIFK